MNYIIYQKVIFLKKNTFKNISFESYKKNIEIHQGSQNDENFIKNIIEKYGNFDIIIDDGSHIAKDVKKTFKKIR